MSYLDWRFFPVFDLIDPATAYQGSYQAGLVALSVVVATLAAFVALSISGRIVAAESMGARWAWASAGAMAMGGGIWGMHFIGMLAFTLPCGVSYAPVGTVASMIPGILASGVALHAISRRTDPGFKVLAVGAVFMGAGIGLMHYSGMAAMLPDALLRYDPLLVGVSVVVAVALAFLSLSIRFSFHRLHSSKILATVVAAPVMGFAVAGMHYTAMQASIFFPLPDMPLTGGPASSPMFLAALIAIFIALVMAITLVATFAGRQVELAQNLAAEVSERKRTEAELITARQQAEAANRAKSQFLATMSHEIRTPMNGVIGTANLLATTQLNERQTQLVENLVRSGRTLLGIINDILDLSKIEAGHFELATVDFDPRELIAEVTDLFSERCTSKGLEFVYFVAEEVPQQVTGDPVRLRQVLINLVGNALKFTETGEILLELSLADTDAHGVTLVCSVTDTGIGIEPEQQARIFETFHQVDASMTRSRGGTGLGLSIVRELVQLMGGKLGVESVVRQGSRFWFTVPLAHATIEPGGVDQRSIERPLRVLVADSNAVSAEVISRYFASWRIDAVIRSTPAEAESIWQQANTSHRPFDVAIIDVKGLRCSGVELARKITTNQNAPRTEVILLVGLDGSIADGSLEDVGACALLTKPPRPSVLFDCLASIASGARDSGVASFYVRKSLAPSQITFEGRILVVEDNSINQEVATGILENAGCAVVTAANGQSAVQLFAEQQFELILMDCEMPVMDGFDATKRIREIERVRGSEASQPRMPIVALTARALAEVRERCLEAGMDDFLVKPFDEPQMIAMLGRWLTPRKPSGAVNAAAAPEPERPEVVETVLDMAAIAKIQSVGQKHGSALFSRIVDKFSTVSMPLLATMRENADEGDTEAVWRAAHTMRSSAAAIGACQVALRCAEIEALAREQGVMPSTDLLAALDADLSAANRALRELAPVDAPRIVRFFRPEYASGTPANG